jgi:hypothetical protein
MFDVVDMRYAADWRQIRWLYPPHPEGTAKRGIQIKNYKWMHRCAREPYLKKVLASRVGQDRN